jgi:hypothetical protein
MIVGTLLIPLSALAALWLTGPDDTEAAESTTTTTTMTSVVAETTPDTTDTSITRADLETACGPEGEQLVALEEDGTISDVQQAALDALRDLCEQQGLSLPAKPADEPIVQTVVIPASPPTTSLATRTAPTYGDHDEYEDDDREDDHEDDDREDDHEDDDREDDD